MQENTLQNSSASSRTSIVPEKGDPGREVQPGAAGSDSGLESRSGSGRQWLAFGVVVVLLGVAGVFSRFSELKQVKQALPLRKSLSQLPENQLGPFEVVRRDVLSAAMVESLGTDHYIQWILRDRSLPESDPLARCTLLVTYYSGGSNNVPHVPDECFLGSGYQPVQKHENVKADVPTLPAALREVPVRIGTFTTTSVHDNRQISVAYTFFCNGEFVCTRNAVRLLTQNPFNHHAFFSKVEVTYPRASRSENLAGTEKVFRYALPLLVRDHWPDFAAAEASLKAEE
ncbi:MAG: hypothetical protein ACYTHJ_18465 [Planctomycetota bacterium]|jgi:hypothetical protein